MICPHCGESFSRTITSSQVETMLRYSKQGMSSREIALIVGCSFATVARVVRLAREANKKETALSQELAEKLREIQRADRYGLPKKEEARCTTKKRRKSVLD